MTMRVVVFGLTLVLALPVAAAGPEPIAVLTELLVRDGAVQVKAAGDAAWGGARPLQSLRPGDEIRASGGGRAVLVFTGGATAAVTSANSPYTVTAPVEARAGERVRSVLAGVSAFLLGQPRERTLPSLAVRSLRPPAPVILGPRNSRVLGDGVVFEWLGSDRLRYRVRLVSAQGVIWQRGDLARSPVAYPREAPPLMAGARYVWELESREHGRQAATFEVAAPGEAAAVREALDALGAVSSPDGSPSTPTVLRAATLAERGFYAEARRVLAAGIAAVPDEPTQHLLLGHVYQHIGLSELAAREFDEAEALGGR